ncbi:MAG: hypothetical protein GX139_02585 [Armatimonadetes bacterium]|jgi:hypothetical protein|nr:hypothetical protein [Armatimonadota bacterium]
MRTLTIDVVADDLVIGQLKHAESYFADWGEMSRKARQLANEACPGYRKLQLRAADICLLDLTWQGKPEG